jgi:hypothetical protein
MHHSKTVNQHQPGPESRPITVIPKGLSLLNQVTPTSILERWKNRLETESADNPEKPQAPNDTCLYMRSAFLFSTADISPACPA